MWHHNCSVDGSIETESGQPCNWCGAVEQMWTVSGKHPAVLTGEELQEEIDAIEQQIEMTGSSPKDLMRLDTLYNYMYGETNNERNSPVHIQKFKENLDGSATVTMDLDPEVNLEMMKAGLKYLINEMRLKDKVDVLEPNDFDIDSINWEITNEEANALFHFGFISALSSGIASTKGMDIKDGS